MSLLRTIKKLRPQLAAAAQEIYDAWDQDDEGLDEELGSGGICDRISSAMADVIGRHVDGAYTQEGGQDGDDHSFLVVLTSDEAVMVDIPHETYEKGRGYSWKKIEGVDFQPDDVYVHTLPRDWFPQTGEDE